jgi:hypothetical protein
MSYLDTPRFHFFGNFFANPSTINNATENYSLTEVYNNNPPSAANPNSVWWNQQGQAFFEIPGPAGQIQPPPSCTVTGALDENGDPVTNDPLLGVPFVSVINGGPPAQWGRIVDLDPDFQMRSMIVGLRIQVTLPGATAPALTGTVQPMTIIDIWGRITQGYTSGLNAPACMYQSVVTDLQWGDVSSSPLLQKLQAAVQETSMLSFKANVDNYDGTPTSPTFNYGRIAGTIGPYFAGEPWHFVAQRKMWLGSSLVNQQAPMVNNAPFQVSGSTLTVDLGNSISMSGTGNSPPTVSPNNLGPVSLVIDPAGSATTLGIYSQPAEYEQQYATYAGIFVLDLGSASADGVPMAIGYTPPTAATAAFVGTKAGRLKEGLSPASLGNPGTAAAVTQIGVAENPNGYYAATDYQALRLENGTPAWAGTPEAASGSWITGDAQVPLVCTQFGQPAAGAVIQITSVPNTYQFPDALGGFPPINNTPMSAITFPASVACDANGRAVLPFTAGPLTPADREPRRADIDGQIFTFSYSYATDFQLQPLTFLVFEDGPVVTNPTWWQDVYPVFDQYARLYPFMRGLIDLSSYSAVTNTQFGWAQKIQAMLSLPLTDPAFMPVTRDLSLLRRQMILAWYQAGAPVGTPPQP